MNLGVPTTVLSLLTLRFPASEINYQSQAQPLRTWCCSIWPAEVGGSLIKGEPELHSKFRTWAIVRSCQGEKKIPVLPLLSNVNQSPLPLSPSLLHTPSLPSSSSSPGPSFHPCLINSFQLGSFATF